MTTEYNYVPGLTQLRIGDVVQLDGGLHIVTRVNDSGACAEPLKKRHVEGETKVLGKKFSMEVKGRVQYIAGSISKNRIIERRGEDGVKEFLKPKCRKDCIDLELGDEVVLVGKLFTVTEIEAKGEWATLGSMDGDVRQEKRCIKKVFLPLGLDGDWEHRLTAEERSAHLKDFLATRKPPASEDEQTAATKETESETVMARKTKTEKKPKAAKREKKTNATAVSYKGRSEFIASQVKDNGVSNEEIFEVVKAKYPGSSRGRVFDTIKKCKAALKAEAKE